MLEDKSKIWFIFDHPVGVKLYQSEDQYFLSAALRNQHVLYV